MLKFDEAKVCVRELDWKTSWPPPVGTYDPSDPRFSLDELILLSSLIIMHHKTMIHKNYILSGD
jgi:hypothetical protein